METNGYICRLILYQPLCGNFNIIKHCSRLRKYLGAEVLLILTIVKFL